jgi:hypothetical protein
MTEALLDNKNQTIEKNPPSIWIPVSLVICAYIGAILFRFEWDIARAIYTLPRAPGAAIESIGAIFPLLMGFVHLAISQFFEGKRNAYTRRYIIIYWSIASIAILLFVFLTNSR